MVLSICLGKCRAGTVSYTHLDVYKRQSLGLAVPIDMYLYICILSADIISEFNNFASSMATAVFPEAVGPQMIYTLFFIKLSA